ncbi:MAG TPA: dihydroxyacetone kinase phosphoryl donor subunit DhaM [Candidatus Limnocylindria bacterium]|jgi:dihydroxyacetone kinase phosphotransfer subunit|nr:dihydroxyacetone kinase phosphoryl donor subunit DhaM [Candidatus Limnocylindria bacterium]
MADAPPPVGIVVVSHSGPLADAVVQLVRQLANVGPDGPRLLAAGGLADGELGTDATRIAEAIGEAERGAGVVVVADIGSALLSAFTAVDELLEPSAREQVRVSGGPLVEGSFVATVQAAAGDPLEAVLAAADSAAQMDKLGGRR